MLDIFLPIFYVILNGWSLTTANLFSFLDFTFPFPQLGRYLIAFPVSHFLVAYQTKFYFANYGMLRLTNGCHSMLLNFDDAKSFQLVGNLVMTSNLLLYGPLTLL